MFQMSMRELAQRLGMAENTARTALGFLEHTGGGLLVIKRRRVSVDCNAKNSYELNVKSATFQNLLVGKGKRVLERSGEQQTTHPGAFTAQTLRVSRENEGTSPQESMYQQSESTSAQDLRNETNTEPEASD